MPTSATRRPLSLATPDRRNHPSRVTFDHAHQILVFATLTRQTLVILMQRQAVAVTGERMYEKDVTLLEGLATLAGEMEDHAEAIERICADTLGRSA